MGTAWLALGKGGALSRTDSTHGCPWQADIGIVLGLDARLRQVLSSAGVQLKMLVAGKPPLFGCCQASALPKYDLIVRHRHSRVCRPPAGDLRASRMLHGSSSSWCLA